jgi:hypothetical protein
MRSCAADHLGREAECRPLPDEVEGARIGRYLLKNLTQQADRGEVHVRQTDRNIEFLNIEFPGAR